MCAPTGTDGRPLTVFELRRELWDTAKNLTRKNDMRAEFCCYLNELFETDAGKYI